MLGGGLGLAVEAQRVQRRFLGADLVDQRAIVAAGGAEEHRRPLPAASPTTRVPSTLTLWAKSGDLRQAGKPTIAARWTTMSSLRAAGDGCRLADVALDELEPLVPQEGQQRLAAVHQRIQHADVVAVFTAEGKGRSRYSRPRR